MYKRIKYFTAALIALTLTLGTLSVYAENELQGDKDGTGELSLLDRTPSITSEATVLTYDAAVKRAISTNSTMKSLEYNLDTWRDLRDDMQTNILIGWDAANTANSYMSVLGYDTYKQTLSGVTSLMRGEQTLKTQINNYQFNEKIVKDSSTYMVRSYLTNIAGYEMDIQMLTESIVLAETNISNLELQHSLGMVSDNDVKKAKQTYQQSLLTLENLKIMLANEKKALNNLLSYDLAKDLVVEWEPTADSLTENLTGFVQDSLRSDPSIKIKENAVKDAEYVIRTSFGVLDESKIQNENNLAIARQNLEDEKKKLEKTILTTYNTIIQMGENQKSLELELEKARDTYNTMLVNYDAGFTTKFQVEQTKLLILQAEIALEKNKYNYSNLIFAFERPYLLMAGA